VIIGKKRAAVLAVAGLTIYGSLLLTAVSASPPKTKHKPTTKKSAGGSAALIAEGKKVYEANKCANCHMIHGKGGKSGPDLTKTGANPAHSLAWFEAEIKNPKSHKADAKMPAYGDKIKGKDLRALATYMVSLKK